MGKAKKKSDLGWAIVGGLSGAAAGVVARKVLEVTWKKTTGSKPPKTPESPDVAMREAVVWTVTVAVTVGVVRLVVARKAATVWRNRTGQLPAPFRPDEDEDA